MEYVGAVLMHVYPADVLAIYIAARVAAFVDHEAFLAGIGGKTREHRAIQARPDYKEIVFHGFMFYLCGRAARHSRYITNIEYDGDGITDCFTDTAGGV